MIFSLVSGIALTLLVRGPAPAPAPQSCYVAAVAEQESAAAISARVIEAVRDSLPAWLADLDVAGSGVAAAGRDSAESPFELRTSLTSPSSSLPARPNPASTITLNCPDKGNGRPTGGVPIICYILQDI
jgi:hypothetical protein